MPDVHPIAALLREDRRYKFEAYVFVFDALRYAHDKLGMGKETPSEPLEPDLARRRPEREEATTGKERHLTGQELCLAIRQFALEQFGFMAKTVLNTWGVHKTGDFGEIVFNLIRVGEMRKTRDDRREDFDDVFDFETDLRQNYRITLPE